MNNAHTGALRDHQRIPRDTALRRPVDERGQNRSGIPSQRRLRAIAQRPTPIKRGAIVVSAQASR